MANLSQQKRERMLAFLETLKKQHNDDESLMAIGQIEKELTSKKYGLVWEEHEEAVDVQMKTHIPVFTEVKEREICTNADENYNFLLEGDNLHSLYLLEKTHRGKIDVIYIDPPYNTLSHDFIYNDEYIDSNDTYPQSKWLSFMEKRLTIANSLLASHGYICISIDDRELYQLKMLCDKIFGEDNFINNIVIKSSEASGVKMSHADKRMPKIKEYVLIYKKDKPLSLEPIAVPKDSWDSEYKSILTEITDDELSYIESVVLNENRNIKDIEKCNAILSNANYEFLTDTYKRLGIKSKEEKLDFNYKNSHRIFQTCSMGSGTTDLINQKRKELCSNIFFCYESAKKKMYIIKGDYDIEKRKPRIQVLFAKDYLTYNPCDLWTDIKTTGIEAEGNVNFKNGKKPVKLIKRLLSLTKNKPTIILDFFAGSGTTGQAVMELNQQDGGNRKFILCTNNENNICEEVTYQRLKTVITGKRADGSEYSEGIPANLKYFKTDFVSKESEELSDELLEHITEMIELEHGIKVDNKKYVIVLTDEEMDNFEQNISNYPDLKAVFVNQDILLTAKQQKLLDSLDSYIIPNYYFNFELREAGELW